MEFNFQKSYYKLLIVGFLISAFLVIRDDYKKKAAQEEIQYNYAETLGQIRRLKYIPKYKRSPERFEAIVDYNVNNIQYETILLLSDDFRYRWNNEFKAEEGDYCVIEYSSINPDKAQVKGFKPVLKPFFEENPDKILGNRKVEYIELENYGADTVGIVTQIKLNKDSNRVVIEYPTRGNKKYKVELEVIYFNDKTVLYKTRNLPTVKIGDSLRIKYSYRVPQVHRLLESAPNVAVSRY